MSVHENLTVDGSATFNAGILNSIFASPSFGNALANVVDSTLQFVDNLLGIKPTASPTLQGLTLNGNMTIANGYSIMPAADGNSFVGNSSTMFLQVSTRNLVIGNNSGGHSLTFSIDNSGTNLTMTSDSGGGSILPDATKVLNLGSSSQKWSSIYCSSLTTSSISTPTSPLTINSGLTVSGNAEIAGYAQFNNDAKLCWVGTAVLAVQDSSGNTNNGGLDVGSVFVNNLQPLNSGSPAGININCPLSFGGSRGTVGQVLTSNGSSSTPTWQASSWNGGTVNSQIALAYADPVIVIHNTNDAVQSYIRATYNTQYFGNYDGTNYHNLFAIELDNGKVGTVSNINVSGPSWRNILDDGSGNMTLAGWLSATSISCSGNILQYGNYLEINPASGNSYIDLRVNGTDKCAFGYNGTNSYVVAYAGNLLLQSASGSVTTNHNTLDDGSGNMTLAGTVSTIGSGNLSASYTYYNSSQRTNSTSYKNTSNKTLYVNVLVGGASGGYLGAVAYIGPNSAGSVADQVGIYSAAISGYGHVHMLHLVVPPYWYYQVVLGANSVIDQWWEGYLT